MFYLPVDVRWNDAPHNLFINSFGINLMAHHANPDGVTPKGNFVQSIPLGYYSSLRQNEGLIDIQGTGTKLQR